MAISSHFRYLHGGCYIFVFLYKYIYAHTCIQFLISMYEWYKCHRNLWEHVVMLKPYNQLKLRPVM